ncbi:MAG: hypothetical protein JW866_02225, partial [Ignavibacteriales bacterium]|nr:hypothetical protein [Ignavibacteriales bacterium]
MFSGGGINDPYRLPVYNLAPGVSFAFSEIYVVVLLLKAILKKRWREYRLFPYRKQFSSLAIYLIVLIFVSLALGASF